MRLVRLVVMMAARVGAAPMALALLVLAAGALPASEARAAPGDCVSIAPGRIDCVAWAASGGGLIHVSDTGQGFSAPRSLPRTTFVPLGTDPECVARSRSTFACFVLDEAGRVFGARFIVNNTGGFWEPTWHFFGGAAWDLSCVMNSWTAVETTCFAIGHLNDVIYLRILEWPTERPGQIWAWGGWGGEMIALDCYESNYRHRKAVCVARGTDGQLYRRDMPSVPGGQVPYETWIPTTGARPVGGYDCLTTPGNLATPGAEEWCVWRHSQGKLVMDIGGFAFDPARSLLLTNWGTVMSRPSCVSWNAGRLDCFYRGADGQLHHLLGSGTGPMYGPWVYPGVILGRPECITRGPGTVDCVVQGTDRNWYHRGYRDGRGWVGWTRIGGPIR